MAVGLPASGALSVVGSDILRRLSPRSFSGPEYPVRSIRLLNRFWKRGRFLIRTYCERLQVPVIERISPRIRPPWRFYAPLAPIAFWAL